ncbi:MAG: hypothetical protein ABW352_06045 [Polyangiales bacterium]
MFALRPPAAQACALCSVLALGACSSASYSDRGADASADGGQETTQLGRDAAAVVDARSVRDAAEETPDAAPPGEDDPAEGEPGEDDAGTPMNASMPAWADSLLGQYGMRVRFFQRSEQFGTPGKVEWLLLGTFAYDAASGKVTLKTEFCDTHGNSTYLPGISADSGPLYPRRLPARVYEVKSDGSSWSTNNAPLRIGFEEQPLVPCATPGARVKAHDSQIWNTDGLCTCPMDLNVMPVHSNDCRINDVDDDTSPAATVAVTGALQTQFHVRHYDASRIVNGVIDANERHHDAKHGTVQDLYQLTCGPQPCAYVPVKQCDASLNPVRVRPLGPSGDGKVYSCDDVLERKAELFGTDPLTFPPSGC